MKATRSRTALASPSRLQAIFELVDQTFEQAIVWSRRLETYRVTQDSGVRGFDQEQQHWVVVGGRSGGAHYSCALLDTSEEVLAQRVRTFLSRFPQRRNRQALELSPLETLGQEHELGLKAFGAAEYRDPVSRMFDATQRQQASRIVFRASYLVAHSSDQHLLSRKHHIRMQSVRSRGGIIISAWSGDELASVESQVAGLGGPETANISDTQIEESAQEALAHLHARSAASGEQEVLLAPNASALLALHGIANRRASALITSSPLRIVDDPSVGYGAMARDDVGEAVQSQVLVGRDADVTTRSGFRRRDHCATLGRGPSNVVVEPGTESQKSLVAGIKQGVLLQGPIHADLDARDQLTLLCAQGREIIGGRFTGRLFGRQIMRAPVQDFVDATAALGEDSATLAMDREGRALSTRAPHWLSRALVEAG